MPHYFVDSFYWIALLYRRDAWHNQVSEFSHRLTSGDVLFTTDAVMMEFLAAFSASGPRMRQQAADQVDVIFADSRVHMIELTRSLFLEGLTLYKARLDKEYSLTDCISMQVMRHQGLTEILTNDHPFTQEGFRILFP
jgi:predicted nucleic acid-binding protein